MKPSFSGRQKGFSIIELMVALAINMVIVTAAAYLYLGTSQSKKELDQARDLNDNGQYALDLIGRDIVNAGFYPTINLGANNIPVGYKNGLQGAEAGRANFNNPVFGCDGQDFNMGTTGTLFSCVNHSSQTTNSDSLVVAYYTNDSFGPDAGHSRDCTGNTINAGALGSPLAAPAFVANRYTLRPVSSTIEGNAINTWSLSCASAIVGSNRSDQPSVMGIEELRFRYSVYTNNDTLLPSRFYTAAQMGTLGTLTVKSPLYPNGVDIGAWGRVVAIEVCVVARAMVPTKQAGEENFDYTYNDCTGNTQTATDRVLRKTYRKVFAVRNNLTLSVAPISS